MNNQKKQPYKKQKLAEKIQNDLNLFLRQELNDHRLQFVSFTNVELSPDNSFVVCFWDTFDNGKRGDCKKALESSLGKLRSLLAKSLQMRKVPEIRLKYNAQFDSELEIENILAEEEKNGRSY